MGEVDNWWTGYAIAIPGIAGSLLSFLYFGAGIWAAISVLFRRFPIDIPRKAMWFVCSCLGYALTLLASSIINDKAAGIVPGLAAGAAFYFVPFIVSRYRFSNPKEALGFLIAYAPLGAVLCLISALYQGLLIREAVEGGAGNSSVFGFVAVMLGGISLANGGSSIVHKRAMAIIGFLAGMAALVMSSTRALYPAVLLVPVAFLSFTTHMTMRNRRRMLFSLFVAFAFAGLLFRSQLEIDFARTLDEVSKVGGDAFATSLGLRKELWKAAIASIGESLWIGYGQIHKMDDVFSRLPEVVSYVRFNHAHNVWIDSLLSGGIIGFVFCNMIFVSISLMLNFEQEDDFTATKNYIVFCVLFIALANSIFNTLFTHDILVCLLLLPLLLVSAAEDISAVNRDGFSNSPALSI